MKLNSNLKKNVEKAIVDYKKKDDEEETKIEEEKKIDEKPGKKKKKANSITIDPIEEKSIEHVAEE